MKYYNKLKFFARVGLVFAILFDLIISFEAAAQNNAYVLFLCCASVFFFILPYYYVVRFIEKQKQNFDENLKKTFDYLENIIKQKNQDSPDEFEKELFNDKDLFPLYEYTQKNKELFLDLRQKNKLLNEILISTVLNRDIEKFLADVMPKIMNITKSQFIVF